MVGLPIGFFSPLPLAMMIPFMATQSLAMGEAFGKSFQYGKRKISSMSNEEFNKLTFPMLMDEQTANIKQIIPKLHEQMEVSFGMQRDIFQEMIKIIPAFFEALMLAWKQTSTYEDFQNFNKTPFNQDIPRGDGGVLVSATEFAPTTTISHESSVEEIPIIKTKSWSQSDFRALSLDELIQGINADRWKGSELSMAVHVLKEKQKPVDVTFIPTIATPLQVEHQKWLKQRDGLTSQWMIKKQELADLVEHNKTVSARQSALNQRRVGQLTNQLRGLVSQIKMLSNDYRHPNSGIRRDALTLRQDIALGSFK